ncbi:tetratricopeptide repeat protein 28-like [Dendronephthya gigantea]|uniref:tetratricopeptide repeat protein 28-like n=1 Tax=Dendronephthya gigantea TaxID=151771 RepID=UPI00106B15F6|nr:tetratricopeptide repeat protein 28-like [Dendronephthya gigantea]
MANTNVSLGSNYLALGRNKEARDYFKEALKLSTAIGYQSGIANSYGNLGNINSNLGKYDKAIDYSKKALDICNSIGDKTGIEKNSNNLGCVYFHLGEYNKAIKCLEKSFEIAKEMDNKLSVARAANNLGETYARLREYEKAISYSKVGLEISTAINNRSCMANSNGVLGNAYFFSGETERAIDYYKKNLELETAMGIKKGIAGANGNLGNAYCSLGEYDKAIDYYKTSFEISNSIGNRLQIATINSNLGSIYRKLGEYEKAIEHCKTGVEISIGTRDPFLLAGSYHNLGIAYQCKGEYEVASTELMKSISMFDELFLEKVPDQNKLAFTGKYFHVHKILMTCFTSSGRKESALLVIDLGRSKELHLSIERKRNSFDADMFSYARSIWSRIEKIEENLEIERIQNILQVGNDETSILVFAFDLENSLNVWVLNSDVIFKCLISDERLRKFPFLLNRFYTKIGVTVNRNSSFFQQDSLSNVDSFDSHLISPPAKPCKKGRLEDLYEKDPFPDHLSHETILKGLFDLLIQPIRDAVKGNKLIVVPDKQLFFVPFSSLIDENGRYLSQSYSIQVTPSLHTLTFTKKQHKNYELGFALFVGNPKVGKVSLNGKDFIPAELPKAAEEVNCLSKLFQAKPLVGSEARKKVVLSLLGGATIIHIAAHGEPNRGEIMLAPDLSLNESFSSPPNPDSYLLTQNDITGIALQAQLVVLCCCHTGQGEISSEGVIGIARSFLAAGARSVLATLWPISDDATKEFMEAFYGELLQGTSVCEALRRVMNLFQQYEREDYRSFLIWAPFTLYGEDVMFTKGDIKKIREKSECGFALFVGNPTSDLPKATEEVNSLSKRFKAKAFVEGEAKKQVLLGLLSGASIIHISAHIEPKQCAIMLSPCGSSNQGSLTLPKQDDFLTQRDVQGLSLKAGLVVLCLGHSEQDEISPEGVETLAQSFLEAGARSVLSILRHSDDDATTQFIKAFYNNLLHESSVREALEKTKELFEKHDKESHRSIVGRSPFTIFGEDVMFQKHDIEKIREKSHKMFSGFVVLPTDELTGSVQNFNLLDKP